MNDSHDEDSPQAEPYFLNVFVPQMKIDLPPRARIVWGKLLRLKYPASARKLSILLGELRISERTVAVALRKLFDKKLVTHTKEGCFECRPAWPTLGLSTPLRAQNAVASLDLF